MYREPSKPHYNGKIIVNPDLQNGSQDWSQYGGAKVDFTEFEGNKVVIVRGKENIISSDYN
ncbi:hypothetical protein YC2023_077623 [Brassica napus]